MALNDGTFTIQVADVQASFWLQGDLTMISEKLPPALEWSASAAGPAQLYLAEQGVDLKLLFERRADQVQFRFFKQPHVSPNYADLPNTTFSVATTIFLVEWNWFTNQILDALVEREPALALERSYLDHRMQIAGLTA